VWYLVNPVSNPSVFVWAASFLGNQRRYGAVLGLLFRTKKFIGTSSSDIKFLESLEEKSQMTIFSSTHNPASKSFTLLSSYVFSPWPVGRTDRTNRRYLGSLPRFLGPSGLIAQIGGIWGFYLGFSAVTALEIAEYVLYVAGHAKRKIRCTHSQTPRAVQAGVAAIDSLPISDLTCWLHLTLIVSLYKRD
jgi:hypothetical protein